MTYFWQNPTLRANPVGFAAFAPGDVVHVDGKPAGSQALFLSYKDMDRVVVADFDTEKLSEHRRNEISGLWRATVGTRHRAMVLLSKSGRRANPTDLTVANTIISQMGGSGRLSAMIGAHSFVGDENSVSFRFKARARNGANALHVTLDPSDTYTVKFFSIRGTKTKVVKELDDVYAEDLKRIFEDETGLRLSL